MTAIAHQGTSPTILIVDDDASLRLLCRVNLELEGYHVLEAPSVAAAEDDGGHAHRGVNLPVRRELANDIEQLLEPEGLRDDAIGLGDRDRVERRAAREEDDRGSVLALPQ